MPEVYRRRSADSAHRLARKNTSGPRYKQTVLRQSVLCLVLFCLCLFVRLSPQAFPTSVEQGIRTVLDTQTDFKAMPSQIAAFFKTHILRQNEGRSLASKTSVSADLQAPVSAPVTSPFGLRTHPTDGTEAFHYGVDLGAPEGEKIKCAAQGTVTEVGENADYGNYILISHPGELYTLYAHCEKVLPAQGDSVSVGQVIATVGATGNATAPHLHFELRSGENWLDPAEFITFEEGTAND